jgi:hypothetical protein
MVLPREAMPQMRYQGAPGLGSGSVGKSATVAVMWPRSGRGCRGLEATLVRRGESMLVQGAPDTRVGIGRQEKNGIDVGRCGRLRAILIADVGKRTGRS